MAMMLMNLPDIGFGNGLNTSLTDAQYMQIKEEAVRCICHNAARYQAHKA